MIKIDGENLSVENVVNIARHYEKVTFDDKSVEKIKRSRIVVENLVKENKTIYGINTGFGELSKEKISSLHVDELQRNLIRSHSCGVGAFLPTEIVRAMMVLRANSLSKGFSGIGIQPVRLILEMLNERIHPLIPEKGSLGASGDLIPLAHMALAMIGEGTVEYKEEILDANTSFKKAGLTACKLTAKEGLALINGTQLMTAIGCLSLFDAKLLLKNAQIAACMSLEALKGTDQAFRKEIQDVRPHPGQKTCARNLWKITRHSEIIKSHRDCNKVQDAYTLRCMPQVIGASIDACDYVYNVISTEINSATDNPLIFPDINESISGGNFHGQPIALALDFLGIAIAEIGDFSERRIARLIDGNLSGLPPFLIENSGLNSGFMLPQYVAAALVSENKILCHPASCDSIPSSANKEDHVSMGATSALKLLKILENVERIVAIEFLTSSQGLEFHKPLEPSDGDKAALKMTRNHVPRLFRDRPMSKDIETIFKLVKNGTLIRCVEEVTGKLE